MSPLIFKCLIGAGDKTLPCYIKTQEMIKQIQDLSASSDNVKITIENFKKSDGMIFTSEKSSIELDTSVIITYYKINNRNFNKYIKNNKYSIFIITFFFFFSCRTYQVLLWSTIRNRCMHL